MSVNSCGVVHKYLAIGGESCCGARPLFANPPTNRTGANCMIVERSGETAKGLSNGDGNLYSSVPLHSLHGALRAHALDHRFLQRLQQLQHLPRDG